MVLTTVRGTITADTTFLSIAKFGEIHITLYVYFYTYTITITLSLLFSAYTLIHLPIKKYEEYMMEYEGDTKKYEVDSGWKQGASHKDRCGKF